MQTLIASYLFQNKTCPLPGLGTFSILNATAKADFANKLIQAPHPMVEFVQAETNPRQLTEYISQSIALNFQDAADALKAYCNGLKELIDAGNTISLAQVGSIFINENGKIIFKAEDLPASFLQPVVAERVIHPEAEHSMLVGDKETTNKIMSELLAAKTTTTNRWWIWAIVLGAVGLFLLLLYFLQSNGGSSFGNCIKL
ncbi:MAG: hypothetical protein R2765_12875 [Ferruginibacter sp.]|nr:hypothetical protein [Bacteroidota bacterium]MBX2918422.1 hypothetical protein [Ferruginibacter sp.]MCB0708808.1 hypothetical protein [Chitinophagaceae bacterium]MCC7379239.1 hypothetical protein [Chitinophagaceae bacterium]